jgi:hypothetical protein
MMCQQYDDMVGNMWMDYKLTRGTFEKAKLAWNQNGWSWNQNDRVTVAVVDSLKVTGCLHLTFIFQGDRTRQGNEVIASFRLVLENQGVGASFRLDLEN